MPAGIAPSFTEYSGSNLATTTIGVLTIVQFIPLFVSAEDMASYVQFPSSGAPANGQYVSYGQVPAATGQPTGNGAGPGGYGAVYPTTNPAYTNPGGSPMTPGSPQPGAQAFMNLRLADGTNTYVPVVAQMVGGRMQWITSGPGGGQPALQASPRGGEVMQPMQAQRTGHDTQPAYADYRAAERDSGTSDRKWYQSSKKDKSSKKTREWEKEARAREEAEERQRLEIAERERIRKLSNNFERERERRASVSAEGRPSGILHHSTSGRDLNQRFGDMGLGPNPPYQSASTRSRRPSTSEAENPYQRARRLSTSIPPDGPTGGDYTRQRTISGNYGAPTTPASRVGAFYPDRERALGRGEYDAPGHGRSPSGGFPMPGTLPAASYVAPDGSGRVMGGGMMVQPGAPGSGFLPTGNHSVATASPDGRLAPPTSFYREPSRSVPYPRFDPFSILWDLSDFRKFSPPLPALLVPSDVSHDDWNRCMQDLSTSWTGVLPYDIFKSPKKPQQKRQSAATPASSARQLVRPSSAVAKTIDIWNASFFYGRKLELILYRGLERRSGLTAGRKTERLKKEQFPPQFQAILYGRYPKRRQRHDSSEDETDEESDESLTSSSTSDSSSSDEESASDEEDRSDDEPAYVTKHRERRGVGSHQMPQTPYPLSRSRRNSLAAHGQLVPANTGLDVHEMWAVKSREAVKVIRARQKIEKKRRKLERRMRRREIRGEPLYSLWIVHL